MGARCQWGDGGGHCHRYMFSLPLARSLDTRRRNSTGTAEATEVDDSGTKPTACSRRSQRQWRGRPHTSPSCLHHSKLGASPTALPARRAALPQGQVHTNTLGKGRQWSKGASPTPVSTDAPGREAGDRLGAWGPALASIPRVLASAQPLHHLGSEPVGGESP